MTSEVEGTSEPGRNRTLEEVLGTIHGIIAEVEAYSDPTIRRRVFDLMDNVDALHREALERLAAGLRGADLFDRAMDDPVVGHVFSIYGLLEELDPVESVQASLDEVRDYTHSHGGEIELVGIDAGVVRVRMQGACDDCPSAAVTLTQTVERSIRERWPGLVRMEVTNLEPTVSWQPINISPAAQ